MHTIKFFKEKLGFTLIEIVIVVGILALLILMVLVVLNPVQQLQKARDTQRKSDLAQIQRALETYYQDKGSYPISTASFQLPVAWGAQWKDAVITTVVYMNQVPKDPGGNKYVYYTPTSTGVSGQTYYLYASLERGVKDSQVCSGGVCATPGGTSPPTMNTACIGPCNFGLTSPDKTP